MKNHIQNIHLLLKMINYSNIYMEIHGRNVQTLHGYTNVNCYLSL